jgi:hypothetical protein
VADAVEEVEAEAGAEVAETVEDEDRTS